MREYVIGLDNGGTVSKAALFDLNGCQMQAASRQTPVITPRPGYTERDMDGLLQSNCECVREVITESGISPGSVIGIAVCGHGKGLYPWGKDGKPAYNGIVSTDNRAWEYPERWNKDGTAARLYPRICQQLLACQQAALLAWMKDNERDVYDNIKWVFSVKDYIRFRLSGEAYCEATDISGSGLMDVRNAEFDRDILDELGIAEVFDKLAPLKYSSEVCGYITEEAAGLTGLNPGIPVAGGMFDIDACAIAMDITSPKQLCSITGTWSINEFISEMPVTGTDIAMNSLFAVPGYYLIEECSATSAGNLDWVLGNCINTGAKPSNLSIYKYAGRLVEGIKPEECDVFYLPFLYGSNAHPLAKASFIGLTMYHSSAHMLRAVFEGVAFSHKTHIDKLLSVREAPEVIRMAGGAVRSPEWSQIFADVFGKPVETVAGVSELGALGAAMSAAVACGRYADYREAASAMVRINEPVLPDSARTKIYNEKYQKYSEVVNALDKIWGKFKV